MGYLNELFVQSVVFEEYLEQITFIRNTVFVEELKIPKNLEWDNQDSSACHFIITSNNNKLIAYARLLTLDDNLGKLGRVAVLQHWRHQGIGNLLVSEICNIAPKLNINAIQLSSQISAVNFYLKLGFKNLGESYHEAGIKHRTMLKTLH